MEKPFAGCAGSGRCPSLLAGLLVLLLAGLSACSQVGSDGCRVSGPDVQTAPIGSDPVPHYIVVYTVKNFSLTEPGWQFLRQVSYRYVRSKGVAGATYHVVFQDAQTGQPLYGEDMRVSSDLLGTPEISYQ